MKSAEEKGERRGAGCGGGLEVIRVRQREGAITQKRRTKRNRRWEEENRRTDEREGVGAGGLVSR